MSTVLVTGGLGFIGSHTVVELVKAGYRPVIIDNLFNSEMSVLKNLEKLLGHKVSFYQTNYQDIDKIKDICSKESVTEIIHFAADKAVGESIEKPLKYYDNNVAGLIKLLVFCEDFGIKNFVFSSSCTVYGEPAHTPVTEDSPFKTAESPYGSTKQMCETILKDSTKVSSSFNSVALRYFNPIGAHPSSLIGELPKGNPANLIPFLMQAVSGAQKELTVFGNDYPTPDGTCIRDYIHVVDLAKAHVKSLKYLDNKPKSSYEVFNIGTGNGTSVLEAIKEFKNVTGRTVPYKIGPRRSGDIVSTYAETTKANKLLGWRAEKTLADALADAWRWQQTL